MKLIGLVYGILAIFISQIHADDGFLCNFCRQVCDLTAKIVTSKAYVELLRLKYMFECGYSPEVCLEMYERNDKFSEINKSKRYNGTVMCSKWGFCRNPIVIPENFITWKNHLLMQKPPRTYLQNSNLTKPYKFIVFNDIHVDPLYNTSKSTRCKSTICCRNDSPDAKDENDTPGKWGYVGMCDLPYRTFNHFVDSASNNHSDALFWLWLGDNPANAYYMFKPEDHIGIIRTLTNKLLENHKGIGAVYPVIGNHEGLPRDHMDWNENGTNWLLENVAEIWSPWLTKESQESMKKCGRYTQIHPNTNLRIIALNSFVRGATNSFIWNNVTDVCGEIAWLEKTLEHAEKSNEKVLIISHFPTHDGFGTKEWTLHYKVLVDRYANIIIGQMAGHTHQDNFQVMKSYRQGEIAGVNFEHPSLTPCYWVLPSYRMYYMDSTSYSLLDYDQYRFNMTKANRQDNPEWYLSYQFKKYYGVNDMEDRTIAKIAENILHNDDTYNKYAMMIYTDGPRSRDMVNHTQYKKDVYCWLTATDYYEMKKCSGADRSSIYFYEHFLPPWEYIY